MLFLPNRLQGPYGSMARTPAWSAGETAVSLPNRRFRLLDLEVRIWRANARRRTSFPVPVSLNRLAAPL